MKEFTHYLGMELQYVAYAVSLWDEAGRPCTMQIEPSSKTHLVILKIRAKENDFETNSLVNRIWKETRCKLESR